jgi:ATP-dependent Lon protease
MFVCTANSAEHSRAAARPHGSDSLPGYTEDEKANIARRYLLPKQMKQNGLKDKS